MNLSQLTTKDVDTIASWLTDIFMDYPLLKAISKDIVNSYEINLAEKRTEVDYYIKYEEAYAIKQNEKISGLLLGMHYLPSKAFRIALMELKSHQAVNKILSKESKKLLIQNCQIANTVVDTKWQKEFLPSADYYYIKYLAVDKLWRKQGIASSLLEQIIHKNKETSTPIIVQTHDPTTCHVYEKAGFKLVKVIGSEKTTLKQYCFLIQY